MRKAILLIAAHAEADPRTVEAYLEDPDRVRPSIRERIERARREHPEVQSAFAPAKERSRA